MRAKNYFIGSKLIFVFLVIAMNVDGSVKARRNPITKADKTDIIGQTLGPVLVGQKVNDKDDQITDFELLMRAKDGIVISVKNIERNLVPQMPQIKLLVLTPHEIQEKANREGDFLYLLFSQFDIKDSKVVVTLRKVWAKGKASNVTHMSGGAETYEYRKVNGRWVRKFLRGYVV